MADGAGVRDDYTIGTGDWTSSTQPLRPIQSDWTTHGGHHERNQQWIVVIRWIGRIVGRGLFERRELRGAQRTETTAGLWCCSRWEFTDGAGWCMGLGFYAWEVRGTKHVSDEKRVQNTCVKMLRQTNQSVRISCSDQLE